MPVKTEGFMLDAWDAQTALLGLLARREQLELQEFLLESGGGGDRETLRICKAELATNDDLIDRLGVAVLA